MTDSITAGNASISTDIARQLAAALAPVFAVENITTGVGDARAIQFQGHLLTDSESAYDHIAARLKDFGYTALLRHAPKAANGQSSAGRAVVIAVPGLVEATPRQERTAIILFVLTVLSVLATGVPMSDAGGLPVPAFLLAGAPFAIALLGPLVAHEMGHYLVSRRLGVATTLPYFIPMPLSPFGTLGAIIRTRSPIRNRRHVLAIGAAGPLSGILVAIPLLVFGLLHSTVQPLVLQPGTWLEGNSILYALVKYLVFGRLLPGGGYDVFVHPVAFGAWGALFVTGLNLIPAGQLDGGHIAYALLGKNTVWLSRLAVVATAVMAIRLSSSWALASLLLLIFGQRHADPLDAMTPLGTKEKLLAAAMLVAFVFLFVPVPLTVIQ